VLLTLADQRSDAATRSAVQWGGLWAPTAGTRVRARPEPSSSSWAPLGEAERFPDLAAALV